MAAALGMGGFLLGLSMRGAKADLEEEWRLVLREAESTLDVHFRERAALASAAEAASGDSVAHGAFDGQGIKHVTLFKWRPHAPIEAVLDARRAVSNLPSNFICENWNAPLYRYLTCLPGWCLITVYRPCLMQVHRTLNFLAQQRMLTLPSSPILIQWRSSSRTRTTLHGVSQRVGRVESTRAPCILPPF